MGLDEQEAFTETKEKKMSFTFLEERVGNTRRKIGYAERKKGKSPTRT